jgi:hypothetical protein
MCLKKSASVFRLPIRYNGTPGRKRTQMWKTPAFILKVENRVAGPKSTKDTSLSEQLKHKSTLPSGTTSHSKSALGLLIQMVSTTG